MALACCTGGLVDEVPLSVFAGLMSAMHHDPELMSAVHPRFLAPRVELVTRVLERARERGEIGAEVDIRLLFAVLPAMVLHRRLVMGEPIDATFVARSSTRCYFPPPTSPVLSHQPRTRHRRESPDVPRQHSRGEHGTQPERGVENDHGHRPASR